MSRCGVQAREVWIPPNDRFEGAPLLVVIPHFVMITRFRGAVKLRAPDELWICNALGAKAQ